MKKIALRLLDITELEFNSRSRKRELVLKRWLAYAVLYRYGYSSIQIAREYHKKASTICNSLKKVSKLISIDNEFAIKYERFVQMFDKRVTFFGKAQYCSTNNRNSYVLP